VWEIEIGSETRLDLLHSTVVLSESIWREQCGVRNGITQKAERNTAENIECGREKLEL
jgi:hypothetical protein